jgi:hypothetical protein
LLRFVLSLEKLPSGKLSNSTPLRKESTVGRFIYSEDTPSIQRVYVPYKKRRRYGVFHFLFDCTLTLFTGGLWLIWVFVREMRRR